MKEQHILFCHEYQKDFNGTRAAIRAGYSERSAPTTAARLVKRADVQEVFAKAHDARMGDLKGTRDEAVALCWTHIRRGGKDAASWMEKLIRVQGWSTESVRLQAITLPAPSFSRPDEIPGLPPTLLPGCNSVASEFSDVPKVLESKGQIG